MANSDKNKLSRRHFLKAGAAAGAFSGISVPLQAAAAKDTAEDKANELPFAIRKLLNAATLPKADGARVVIVGGGWSGLTMAKYLKIHNPAFDVVLIDKRPEFISFPASNSWLANQVNLDFLTHSYIDAARTHDYYFLNTTVLGFDREVKKVFTSNGFINYDYMVLAPGIEYDYSRIGVDDPADQARLYNNYPGGFVNSSELITIKRKLNTFKGGTFVLNVPNGEYRCTAAPYERACMAAAIFKQRRIKAKILLLDMNADIRIKKQGFEKAFSSLYGDYISYLPSSEISQIDIDEKTVSTDFDDYTFDDAIIYPPVRASSLLEDAGIANMKTAQKIANTDPYKYHVIGDEYVYVTGDSRSQPFSKGGHTANSEAQYVAEVIAAHALGKEARWRSPQTMCFSAVDINPLQAMSIITFYKFNKQSKEFEFDRTHMMEDWNSEGGQASLAWAEGMYRDMFYR
ncbi:MAG: NAD(P)/FAD-dependent oxidoreductase [Gammaproteobacteria bacterium]|nr:NAD(P)/FAD-dependent oxidoreductase [Gammaproteobacteria bacterium]NNJ50666.1 NAD(P)/FAD-dependent oxidoreductase [Gammaproteobacteria bacterium]